MDFFPFYVQNGLKISPSLTTVYITQNDANLILMSTLLEVSFGRRSHILIHRYRIQRPRALWGMSEESE